MTSLVFGVLLLGMGGLLFLQSHAGHPTSPDETGATMFLTLAFLSTFWAGLVAI